MSVARIFAPYCVAGLMLASSAWGQPAPAAPAQSGPVPPSPARSTGASPPAGADPALAPAPPDPSPASPEDVAAQASAAFQRGLELQRDKDYSGAIVEFERAYDLSPAYQVLYYIGAMNVRLERWARARRAFEMYLELGAGQLSPERISEVRVHLDALSKKTVTLTLMLNVPGAAIHIDGEPVAPTAIAGLVIDPGEHVVRATKPGFKPLEQVLRANDGENLRVVLPLARVGGEAPASGAPRVSVEEPLSSAPDRADEGLPLWVPWTLTGVLAAGWVTTAGLAIKARHDRDVIEQPGTPDHRIDDARRLHMTLAVVSDVLLVSTLASAGISAYLTWWPESPSSSGATPAADGLRFGMTGHF